MIDAKIGTYEHHGLNITIAYDTCPENPREEDNLGWMIGFVNGVAVINEYDSPNPKRLDGGVDELMEILRADGMVEYVPLIYYGDNDLNFGKEEYWDEDNFAIIAAFRRGIERDLGWKRLTQERRLEIRKVLEDEVRTYMKYMRGEVYGFIIEHDNGDKVDACWGFYDIDECKKEAESVVNRLLGIMPMSYITERLTKPSFTPLYCDILAVTDYEHDDRVDYLCLHWSKWIEGIDKTKTGMSYFVGDYINCQRTDYPSDGMERLILSCADNAIGERRVFKVLRLKTDNTLEVVEELFDRSTDDWPELMVDKVRQMLAKSVADYIEQYKP